MHFLFTIRVLQPPDTTDVCGLMQGRDHWTKLCTIPTVWSNVSENGKMKYQKPSAGSVRMNSPVRVSRLDSPNVPPSQGISAPTQEKNHVNVRCVMLDSPTLPISKGISAPTQEKGHFNVRCVMLDSPTLPTSKGISAPTQEKGPSNVTCVRVDLPVLTTSKCISAPTPGENLFQCEVCAPRFTDHTALRNHKRTHTGEKPFQCAL